MSNEYCLDCVDGGNELSWLDENDNVQTEWEECETCDGTGLVNHRIKNFNKV